MKRILAAVLMCGAGSCIAADAAAVRNVAPVSPAAAKAKPKKAVVGLDAMAPADEYFGPLKLSIIGISNTIRDVGLRYTYNHDIAPQSLASAQLTESAVRDWMRRYPRDPQLPRNVFFLQRLYTKILLQQSRDRAAVVAKLLLTDFPSSPQARQLKKTLALEHLAPLSAPAPSDAPTPEATAPTSTPAYVAPPSVVPSGAIVPTPLVSGAPGSSAASSPLPSSPLPSSPLPSSPVPSAGSPMPSASSPSLAPPYASPTLVATPVPRASATPAVSTTPLPSPPPMPVPTVSPAPMPTMPAVPSATPGASPVPTASTTPH